ncbi:MAG: hypothetical protein JO083_08310 [Candidatus Eremiobacteraeota bacterium]|nr:hypothetical protein [Candidatus Eremiobacteraeota bacterium]
MRTHRTHELLAPWSVGTPVLDPARLAAVRIEPVLRQRRPALVLDFTLAGEGGTTVIPLVLADPATVVERDRDPLIFPAGTPGDDAFALALGERILPHLERLVLAGEPFAEHVVRFGEVPCFDAARAAGCYGAAPLREALVRLAPYRYARRFVRGRTVRIDAPDAIGGWALLRALGTVGVAAGRRDPAALAWYGDAPEASGRADVAIVAADADPGDAACVLRLDPGISGRPSAGAEQLVEVVDPLPLDVGVSSDPAEGPVRRWFAVERAPEPAVRAVAADAYAAAGGSSGRVAVVLGRAHALVRPGADTDEARALVAALGAEGFDAVLAESPDEAAGADLVHLIGTRDGRRARTVVEAARRAGVPVAVHAHDNDAPAGGWWGAEVSRYCFEYGADEHDIATYLGMLARRAVSVGPARADVPYAPPEAAPDDAAAALRDASVVFAASEDEAETIRRRTGRTAGVLIVPPLAPPSAPVGTSAAPNARVGRLVGADPFVLAEAPIGPLGNQLLVARCAADAGIPLVVAGPVADASYLERVREFGGPGLIVLAGAAFAAAGNALRAAAAVVVDAAWVGEGGARLAAAAQLGTRIVLADRRPFEAPGVRVRRFDPADAGALTRALGEAWDEAVRAPGKAAPETLAALAPAAVVRALLRGYAASASPVT